MEFQNEPKFSSRRCDRLLLIKASKLVELANINLLAGRKGYLGKAAGGNGEH